ncbi:hypothetical protein RJT80_01195 [Buchnera aphidicola (Periphyllus koelreuteriae)]|uniref:outer membrane beta-barrel protein n=1 Tax=Buchnera aphidicola TaxID=9 RepID=UPI0031B86063
MKHKLIFLSLLLGSSISTAQAENEIPFNPFYIGSSSILVQPNNATWIDLLNVSDSYKNSWKQSSFGLFMGYRKNKYFSFELSYNNPFVSFPIKLNSINDDEKNHNSNTLYFKNVDEQESKESKLNKEKERRKNPLVDRLYPVEQVKKPKHPISNKNTHIKPIKKRSYDASHFTFKKYTVYPQPNIEFATKLTIPVTQKIDLYGSAGLSYNLYNILDINYQTNPRYFIRNNLFPIWSAGIEYKINNHLSSRVEYKKKIYNFTSDSFQYNDIHSINFNFTWNFKNIIPNILLKTFQF